MEGEKGQIIQIDGRFGFLMNPRIEVLAVDGGIATVRTYPNVEGGILSEMNTSRHSVDMLEGNVLFTE